MKDLGTSFLGNKDGKRAFWKNQRGKAYLLEELKMESVPFGRIKDGKRAFWKHQRWKACLLEELKMESAPFERSQKR